MIGTTTTSCYIFYLAVKATKNGLCVTSYLVKHCVLPKEIFGAAMGTTSSTEALRDITYMRLL